MRLSWNEIRARAAEFAREWRDAVYERGEAQTFYNEFFAIFGVTRRRVASFEEPVRTLGSRRRFTGPGLFPRPQGTGAAPLRPHERLPDVRTLRP